MANFDRAVLSDGQGGPPAARLSARLDAEVTLIEMREGDGI
jgi:hypothetical protein